MVKQKILLIGNKSFAAKGLSKKLILAGHEVDHFSRGKEKKEDRNITGNVFSMCSNQFLRKNYDIIINFVIIKNSSVKENLSFIKELVRLGQTKKIKHLIQISSISVYPNDARQIYENSLIENDISNKGSYAAIKVAVDNLLNNLNNLNFHISFVRPGFIIAKNEPVALAGILKVLPFNYGILLGDKETILPIVSRSLFHESLLKIIKLNIKLPVYLTLSNSKNTKYMLVKRMFNYKVILLPKSIILPLSKILLKIKIFDVRKYKQIQGLFKITVFNSLETERVLDIKY